MAMEELGFDRREGDTLIFFDASGTEFELVADEALLHEVRAAVRANQAPSSVSAAQVQALLRQGNSRAEVALQLGCDPADVEPYEHPVIAEIEFTVSRAKQAQVRVTGHGADATQEFGDVLTDRLRKIGADQINWTARKDLELGWQVLLEFVLQGQTRTAIWNFELPTQTLTPANQDAVSITKQGNVADALIPKLRAINTDQVDGEAATGGANGSTAESEEDSADDADGFQPDEHDTLDFPQLDEQLLDHTKRLVQQSATSNAENAFGDAATGRPGEDRAAESSETQDLLDALRRKRGGRAGGSGHPAAGQSDAETAETPLPNPDSLPEFREAQQAAAQVSDVQPELDSAFAGANSGEAFSVFDESEFDDSEFEPWNITGVNGNTAENGGDGSVSPQTPGNSTAEIYLEGTAVTEPPSAELAAKQPAADAAAGAGAKTDRNSKAAGNTGAGAGAKAEGNAGSAAKKRRRKAMPSWDDILFGTRSDEDPS